MSPLDATDVVLVLAARDPDGGLCRASAELLTAARRVGTPVAVLSGPVGRSIRAELGRFGARRIWTAARAEIDLVACAAGQAERRCEAVLMPGDAAGRAIAGRLAVRLEAGLVTDVVGLGRESDGISVLQSGFDGRVSVTSMIVKTPVVLTIRPGAIPARPPSSSGALPEIAELCAGSEVVDRGSDPTARLLRRTRAHPLDRKLLTEADVVVAGGRGVGSAEGFALLAEIARALGGCLGATHTAGELGWAPDHVRISLPGNQIRPRLYFAGGVSGSLRHRAAIRGARTVVAVDRDPHAPMLREADLAVVGDLHQILPALLAELRRRGRGGPPSTEPFAPAEA